MKRKKSGFTLIEMVIVLALTVLVLGITTTVFVTGNKVFVDSDVKTTLQMEAKDIQEKLSSIGMQAIKINSITGDADSGEISSIEIVSYSKDGNEETFQITKDSLSDNIDSFKIVNKDIIPTVDNPTAYLNASFIQFAISLKKEKGYTKAEQPVNFTVTFRNKS